MAINRVLINKDKQALADFLNDSGFFGNVELDNNVVKCYDEEDNLLAALTFPAVQIYWNSSDSFAITLGSQSGVDYGYSCTNGIMLTLKSGNYWAYIMITKTNNNKIAFIVSYTSSSSASDLTCVTKVFPIAWGDQGGVTVNNDFKFTPNERNWTTLVPFVTYCDYNNLSYTPNAGYFPVSSNYDIGDTKVVLNNNTYITNGYWAIKD